MVTQRQCLVYLPHSYTGRGPAESCVQIVRHFGQRDFQVRLFVGRAKAAVPDTVEVVRGLPRWLNLMPWKMVAGIARWRMENRFRRELRRAEEPGIAYFWPGASIEVVREAKQLGWVTAREMTNRTVQAAKESLDRAFALAGETRPHHISEQIVATENAILPEYDFVFSSNAEVDRSLETAGVAKSKIGKTSFGWTREKFEGRRPSRSRKGPLRIGYLGTVSIGKGVIDLIDAFRQVEGDAELLIAGPVDWSMAERLERACAEDPRIRKVGYVDDMARFFCACDIVAIPTLDEGGPQVTYEAATAGAAIVGTPFARARMLEDGRNSLLFPIHDPSAMALALRRLRDDPGMRDRLGRQAREDAEAFRYDRVGAQRAQMLDALIEDKRAAAV